MERLTGGFCFLAQGSFPKRNPKAEPLVSLSSFSSHQEKESLPRLEGRMKRKKKSPAAKPLQISIIKYI